MTVVDWDWRVPVVQRQTPREPRYTRAAQIEYAPMVNGQEAKFCRDCGRLAFCPQCGMDLRGTTICHRAMSTHYRDEECSFNGNWMTDYARKGNE